MVVVGRCYEQWGAAPSPTESAHCLQLDRAAYAYESITAWATPGHFFSDWSFLTRQLGNVPPYDPALSGQLGQSRRLAAYEALVDADDRVARELSSPAAPTVRATHTAADIGLQPETIRAITRRAVNDATGPYLSSASRVARARNCYESLVGGSVEERVYCLQFDAITMALEASELPQHTDHEGSDYYSPQRFIERQLLHLLPLGDVIDAEIRRRGVRFVLNAAVDAAMVELLARREGAP
ncbi:MAG: hypothetical protein AB7Q23_08180 [Hyphomonadaceae bacterium]